jgi:hypothetical protein
VLQLFGSVQANEVSEAPPVQVTDAARETAPAPSKMKVARMQIMGMLDSFLMGLYWLGLTALKAIPAIQSSRNQKE